ncbi:MAG: vacuolar transport chaperone [Trebouxia sp. A1-2]|nr:MAG: vacuolar transport chaperone [Trebouxia sp. A1-2]
MKFGKYIDEQARPDWRDKYLDYGQLKQYIKEAVAQLESGSDEAAFSPRTTSLSVAKNANNSPESNFFNKLELEVKKISEFTEKLVKQLRAQTKALQAKVTNDKDHQQNNDLMQEAQRLGDEFLSLEKYVNLNYLGFHKILKKHDKLMPHAPCRQFYITHLHQQPWVQGNYSDVLVHLSNIYSDLRGDTSGVKNEDSAQGFVRSTTKYWVRTQDATSVKHHILQHLPVFQFKKDDTEDENGPDNQLINSVYLDNSSMELYHGRLDKKPNALAIRIRWYGSPEPGDSVFVERKTHRESWKGEESVKDRITLPKAKIFKTDNDKETFKKFFQEVQQAVDSKQLRPMIRTQYNRAAFQVPFDATVRISLDTNLAMIKENTDGQPVGLLHRWYRDPNQPIPRTDITRFPHAVLEVKLSLPEGQVAPEWVTDLTESGFLTEVHKFSKFIHGTATLLPDMIAAVPYWIDDESVRPSMLQSAGYRDIHQAESSSNGDVAPLHPELVSKPRRRTGDPDNELTHPLLGDEPTLQLMPNRNDVVGIGGRREKKKGFLDWWFTSRPKAMRVSNTTPRTTPMRIEPKTFFANERTFLTWMHMAVTIGTIAAALLGFSGSAQRTDKPSYEGSDHTVEIIAAILLPVAILMCVYSLTVFIWRSKAISKKQVGYIDDPRGPLGLAGVVVLALTAILILEVLDFVAALKAHHK